MRSVTIGVFDGVHLGHTYIAKKTVECAQSHHLVSTAMIFEVPYKAIVSPQNFEGLLTTADERIELLKKIGIDEVIVKKLEEIVDMEPYDFVKMIVKDFHPKSIHIGHDFRFGKDARGDTEMLEMLGKDMGFSVDVIPKIVKNGNRVSSSLIRYELKTGKPEKASSYLGRPFQISGKVFRERGLGSKLGFPTANFRRSHPLLLIPRYGVYLVKSKVDDKEMYGLLNVGRRPTTDYEKRNVTYEVYFIDHDDLNLVGKYLRLDVLSFLREERKFPSISALKEAISNDVKVAKSMLDLK